MSIEIVSHVIRTIALHKEVNRIWKSAEKHSEYYATYTSHETDYYGGSNSIKFITIQSNVKGYTFSAMSIHAKIESAIKKERNIMKAKYSLYCRKNECGY